ncbi:adhesion G protein-coupled receptor L3-like isoform X2 [Halichondria panicea]
MVLPLLVNGEISYTNPPNKLGAGTKANYTCIPGFLIDPENGHTRTCLTGGTWSGTNSSCRGQSRQLSGDLRLVDSSGQTEGCSGRLEVYYSGQWGTVCDDSFGPNATRVACRQLGFSTYTQFGTVGALGFSQPSSSTPIWVDELRCLGTESRLIDCPANAIGVEDCTHSEDVALICTESIERCSTLNDTKGEFSYSNDTDIGSVATLTCNNGYEDNNSPATCTPSAVWTTTPICTSLCMVLPLLVNGEISYTNPPNKLGAGTKANYTCIPGFLIDPENGHTRTCLTGGTWSGTNATCREFDGGCKVDFDLTWNIEWPNTPSGSTSTQQCPGGNSVTGQATRLCNSDGEWEDPNVLSCQQMEFIEIEFQISNLSDTLDSATIVKNTVVITQQLAMITVADTTPLLPSSLNTTNQVLTAVIKALEQVGNDAVTTETNKLIVDVFSNILERNNSITWMALQENTGGSQVLLSNAERFSVLLAHSQSGNDSTKPVRISRPNIAISAKLYDGSQMDELKNDLTFPQKEDLANYSISESAVVPAQISIPPGFLQERLSQQNGSRLPVTFILLQNLEAFLPSSARGLGDNTGSASVVISSQVGDRGLTGASVSLKESPILLNFSLQSVQVNESTVQYHCVFWNFSDPVGNGGWITDGVNTVGNALDRAGRSTVNCTSSHLTSFAVLFTAVRTNETRGDEFALELVSYIGCTISIISLLLAVIFYLVQGKTLFTSVHNFVHLNLCISLLLSYSVFVAGVSTAVGNTVGCAFVAALLHYLLLSSFCWMLCEGVMLYLMLVVVFSRLAKTWWFFLLLGYVTPIPIVAVTVGIRWQYYETLDVCWLPRTEGTIFGFIVPVLVIMVINFVFIVIALRVTLKNLKGRAVRTGMKDSQSGKQKSIARSILLATVVLLPLLGLTWLFGLLVIVATSPVFDWLFTILNSLQGLAILFFHVIRSDKVWSRIGPHFSSAMDLQEVEDESPPMQTIHFQFKFKGATVVVYPNAGVSTAEL